MSDAMKIAPVTLACRNAESKAWNFTLCLCLPRRSEMKADGENPDTQLPPAADQLTRKVTRFYHI
jgi:hypothetical protein